MIQVKGLSKNFSGHWALDGTSWELENKRTLGLLGPNGAGKSTTLKIITGLLHASKGSVFINGHNIRVESSKTRALIGYLPETPPLYDELTVQGYLYFVAGLKSIPRRHRLSAMERVIERLNLQTMVKKRIHNLSKGYRQRVGIAQALIGNPAVLILDEPSVGLDPQSVIELREIILSLKGEHTLIVSSHMLSEVQQICDDVVILDKGKVVTSGSLENVLKGRNRKFRLKLWMHQLDGALLGRLKHLDFVTDCDMNESEKRIDLWSNQSLDILDPVLDIVMKSGCGIVNLEKHQERLEDAFMEATRPEESP